MNTRGLRRRRVILKIFVNSFKVLIKIRAESEYTILLIDKAK